MTLSKVCYTLGIAFTVLGTLHAIVLIWSNNIVVWKSLWTLAALFCASMIWVAVHSWLAPRVELGTPPQTSATAAANQVVQAGENQSQVTYVFDRDLIRFLKFAGSILAIFLVIGAFLFGVDLKKTLEVVQKTREDTLQALHQTTDTELSIRAHKADVAQHAKDSKAAAEEIETARQKTLQSATFAESAERNMKKLLRDAEQGVAKINQAYTLLPAGGKAPPAAAEFRPEQAARLIETKLLKTFRNVLSPEAYAKLEKEIQSEASVGLHRFIYDAQGRTAFSDLPGKLVRKEGEPATKDPLVTQVYDNVGTVYKFFHTVFGRNSLDDHGMAISATVHYGQHYDNAFWDGQRLVVGDGDGVIFNSQSFGALSIVAAELSHAVIQSSANLEYSGQPGALHSHFTDVFAALTEQWQKNQTAAEASWLIGAGLLAPGIKAVALRSLKAPGTAYDDPKLGKDRQPDHMNKYVNTDDDNGGVHINSGIPNRAFYEVAMAIGGHAWEKAGMIWYQSLLRLTPTSNFDECARRTYEVAGDLYGKGSQEREAVRKGWEKVGIVVGKEN